MCRVSPVHRSLDGWEQRDACHDNDTGECRAKKLEGERAARQRLTQLQCALEITVDREHAARHKVWDEESKSMTQWLRQAFTEFGTRLQQQVRRKDLEEQAKDEEQRSRNRAEQAIWEVQNKQLKKETTKLKEQQQELVTAAKSSKLPMTKDVYSLAWYMDGHVIQPNLLLAEVYSLTLIPMDTEAQALIQILQSILDH